VYYTLNLILFIYQEVDIPDIDKWALVITYSVSERLLQGIKPVNVILVERNVFSDLEVPSSMHWH
jgi:hypothetical protein